MHTPSIERLAHVGIHVQDLDKSLAFYRDMLGLQISDENREAGLIFMSSHPDEEHHEVLLASGRNVPNDVRLLQQIQK